MPKTKLEIIDETVEAYKDVKNRAIAVDSGCVYVTRDGRMCAVGRCLLDESTIFEGAVDPLIISVRITGETEQETLDRLLKEEYRGHDIEFWRELQTLHDRSVNFKDGTWSEDGLSQIAKMKSFYEEDKVENN